jgi:hypothetical protein
VVVFLSSSRLCIVFVVCLFVFVFFLFLLIIDVVFCRLCNLLFWVFFSGGGLVFI